ncbi:MAG TPA: hypothetical protein VGM59_05075 [Dongiaceae bacterium]|jgi:hypothetical protein
MMKTDKHAVVPFIFQSVAGWLYYWFDVANFGDEASADAIVGKFRSALDRAGLLIPKARSFAAYFDQHGNQLLAGQILRGSAFCAGLFIIIFVAFIGHFLLVKRDWSGDPRQDQTKEQIAKIDIIGRMGLAVSIAAAYFNFVGFRLPHDSYYPVDSTEGQFVIATPIFGFAFLFLMTHYALNNRSFVRSKMTR